MNVFYTIEVEATNFCNARCEFCNHSDSAREKGFLDVAKFETFLDKMEEVIAENRLFIHGQKNGFLPKIVFGGLGEALIHPDVKELIFACKKRGFYVSLITNGKLLNSDKAKMLIESGIDEIDVSLHTLNEEKEFAITGLHLDYGEICEAVELLRGGGINVEFWRILSINEHSRDDVEDAQRYEEYVQKCGLTPDNVLGPSLAWSRDGKVADSRCETVQDDIIWCHKIIFTFNVDWQGNVVLCCNDYCRESVDLGNVFDTSFDFDAYFKKIGDIADKKAVPEICRSCRRWRDMEYKEIEKIYKIQLNDILK